MSQTDKPDCISLEDIGAFIERNLSPEEHARVERHLVQCRICRETAALALQLEEGVPPETPPIDTDD